MEFSRRGRSEYGGDITCDVYSGKVGKAYKKLTYYYHYMDGCMITL